MTFKWWPGVFLLYKRQLCASAEGPFFAPHIIEGEQRSLGAITITIILR